MDTVADEMQFKFSTNKGTLQEGEKGTTHMSPAKKNQYTIIFTIVPLYEPILKLFKSKLSTMLLI